jgi:hypothetical protein
MDSPQAINQKQYKFNSTDREDGNIEYNRKIILNDKLHLK